MSFLLQRQLIRIRPCYSKYNLVSWISKFSTCKNGRGLAFSSRTCMSGPQTFGSSSPSHQKLLVPSMCLKLTTCSQGFSTTTQRSFYEDRETKTIAVWKNLRELRASPLPALSLGLSGLIPFIAAPAYMISQGIYMPDIAFAQLAYGASILSFLGGVRWGFTLPEESVVQPNWFNLGYSVAPSLVAWLGLLAPPTVGIMTVMSGLAFSAYMDLTMYGYPAWFKGLRFLLSFVAILSLWSTFMCVLVLKNHPEKLSEGHTDLKNEISEQES